MKAQRLLGAGAVRLALALALMGGISSAARADVVTGAAADAYGLQAIVNLTGGPVTGSVVIGPINNVSAPPPGPPFSASNTILTFGSPANPVGMANTGILTSAVSSNVNGIVVSPTTSATATVHNLNVALVPNLVSLTAVAVQSNAAINGPAGALVPSGSTAITGGSVSVLGGVPILLPNNPAANTVIPLLTPASLHFADLILNEQITSGDGSTGETMTTNAIDLKFLPGVTVPLIGNLSGQVIVSHSFASEGTAAVGGIPPPPPPGSGAPIPEPASAALLGLGLASLAGWRRWRQGRA